MKVVRKKIDTTKSQPSPPRDEVIIETIDPVVLEEPTKQSQSAVLIALCLATVNESVAGNMLLPFVGNLISAISHKPLSDSGFASGFIVAAFHLGQMLSGTSWGRMGDRVGRRPVIFSGLVASILTQILFGLSPSIPMLVISRLLQGMGNGNMATIKTVVAEISTKENEAWAFSLLTFGWGIGTVAGQAVGGFTFDPVTTWGLWNDVNEENAKGTLKLFLKNLLIEFPALLPCLIAACYGIFSFFLLLYSLEETNTHVEQVTCKKVCCFGVFDRELAPARNAESSTALPNNDDDSGKRNNNKNTSSLEENSDYNGNKHHHQSEDEQEMIIRSSNDKDNQQQQQQHEEKKSKIQEEEEEEEENEEYYNEQPASPGSPHPQNPRKLKPSGRSRESVVSSAPSSNNPWDNEATVDEFANIDSKNFGVGHALKISRLRVVLGCYMTLACHDIAFVECFPLLAVLSLSTGGLDLSVAKLGLLNTAIGVAQISSNVLFPLVYPKIGKNIFPISALLVSLFTLVTPTMTLVAVDMPHSTLIPIMVSLLVLRQYGVSSQYTTVSIMLKDSAPKRVLGVVMGLTQSMASLVRVTTPIFAAPFFAWTATHEFPFPKPFNVSLIFIFCAFFSVFSAVYSASAMNFSFCSCFFRCCCCCCFSSQAENGSVLVSTTDDEKNIKNSKNKSSEIFKPSSSNVIWDVHEEDADDTMTVIHHQVLETTAQSASPMQKTNSSAVRLSSAVLQEHEERMSRQASVNANEMIGQINNTLFQEKRFPNVVAPPSATAVRQEDNLEEIRAVSTSQPREEILMPWEENGDD